MTAPIGKKTIDVHATQIALKERIGEVIDQEGNKDGKLDLGEIDTFIDSRSTAFFGGPTLFTRPSDLRAAEALRLDVTEGVGGDHKVNQSGVEKFGEWFMFGHGKPNE
jgi:hypothetical protein